MRISVALALAAQLLVLTPGGMALAASFKMVGNGLIQVKAYGETLVFSEVEPQFILFSPVFEPCHAPRYGDMVELAWIFGDETLRTCVEKATPDKPGKSVGIIAVRPRQKGDDVYPGAVKRDAFPKFGFNYNAIKIDLGRRGENFVCQPMTRSAPDRLGFVSQSFDSDGTQYELPASLRKGGASRPLCMQCAPILGDQKDQECRIHVETPDGLTSMVLSWEIPGFHGPDQSWLTYDETVRTIANSIFTERPQGNLQ